MARATNPFPAPVPFQWPARFYQANLHQPQQDAPQLVPVADGGQASDVGWLVSTASDHLQHLEIQSRIGQLFEHRQPGCTEESPAHRDDLAGDVVQHRTLVVELLDVARHAAEHGVGLDELRRGVGGEESGQIVDEERL